MVKNAGLFILSLIFVGITAGCATQSDIRRTPKITDDDQRKAQASQQRPLTQPKKFNIQDYKIDYPGLANYLKLYRRTYKLGYESANFNSCKVGYGFSRNKPCYDLIYATINFRLQCRDSEGTTSETQGHSIQSIGNQRINSSIQGQQQSTRTDSEGYGQIQFISETSPYSSRVKISNGRDFLYIRAKDISRIVTPASWCR